MPRSLVVCTLTILATVAHTSLCAQPNVPRDTSGGFIPKQHVDTSRVDLKLGNWHDGVPLDSPKGVLFRFDYTKLLEWLIPKKKPLIPPECDPKFMRDWIPDTVKPASTKIDMPV